MEDYRVIAQVKLADKEKNITAFVEIVSYYGQPANFVVRGFTPYACGCIHEEIAEAFPELKPLIALHLCDTDGKPMHAVENGWFWYEGACTKDLMEHLRIDETEATYIICKGMTKDEFAAYCDNQLTRWKEEAEEARFLIYRLAETHPLRTPKLHK